MRKAVMVTALICLAAMTVSCRPAKEIVTETKIEYVHDTTETVVHDTTIIKDSRVDSVDRYVEKVIYVDSNGVVHEKEVERLTHYIYQQDEQYKAKESEYKSKISELEKQLSEQTKVEYVEKDLNWFQKTLIGLGWCFIGAIIVAGVCLFFKLKRKVS